MRVIQLGIGGMGNHWIEKLKPLDFIDYVGFVEINPAIAKTQAEKHQLNEKLIFPSLEAALEAVETDVVLSILPPQFRIQTLQTCIQHQLPLIAEKPLAESMAEAETQLKVANESGLTYIITQNYRYEPLFQTVKQILDSGELGRIDAVSVSHYRTLKLKGFRAEMPYPLLNDMAIHHFDLLRFLLGTDPLSIFGQSWSSPYKGIPGKMAAAAILNFPDNIHVSYNAAWGTSGQETTYNGDWRIDGENGTLTVTNDVIQIQKIIRAQDKSETFTELAELPKLSMKYSSQAYMMWELAETLKKKRTPVTTIQDNIKSLQMVFDLIQSSETGQTIQYHREQSS